MEIQSAVTDTTFALTLKQIGEQLAGMRKAKGYTSYEAFAVQNNLPRIQYWRLEKGKANFTLRTLLKVLDIHHIPIDEFFVSLYKGKRAA